MRYHLGVGDEVKTCMGRGLLMISPAQEAPVRRIELQTPQPPGRHALGFIQRWRHVEEEEQR